MQDQHTNAAPAAAPFSVNDFVEKTTTDYTGGRKGRVIELAKIESRARVLWLKSKSGHVMKLRTWVRFQDLRKIESL